jgi:hypothetical protein
MWPSPRLIYPHKSPGTLRNPPKGVVYDEVLTRHRGDELKNCRRTGRNVHRLLVPNKVLAMSLVDLVPNCTDDMEVGTFVGGLRSP